MCNSTIMSCMRFHLQLQWVWNTRKKRTYTAVTEREKKSQKHVKQDAKKVVKACNFYATCYFVCEMEELIYKVFFFCPGFSQFNYAIYRCSWSNEICLQVIFVSGFFVSDSLESLSPLLMFSFTMNGNFYPEAWCCL